MPISQEIVVEVAHHFERNNGLVCIVSTREEMRAVTMQLDALGHPSSVQMGNRCIYTTARGPRIIVFGIGFDDPAILGFTYPVLDLTKGKLVVWKQAFTSNPLD